MKVEMGEGRVSLVCESDREREAIANVDPDVLAATLATTVMVMGLADLRLENRGDSFGGSVTGPSGRVAAWSVVMMSEGEQ